MMKLYNGDCLEVMDKLIGIELDMDYFLTACERIGQTEL